MCCFIRLNPVEHMPVTSVQQSYHLYRLDVKWQCGGRSRWEYSQDSRCLLLPWMFGNKWEPGVLESTHPLRDATLFRIIQNIIDIAKIHASLAECDKIFPIRPVNNGLLKSTHPLRDATTSYTTYRKAYDAKIHASLARCDNISCCNLSFSCAKIHASLAGCDTVRCFSVSYVPKLTSTHPLRDATTIFPFTFVK